MRIVVDVDKCCGAGQCVLAAPTVFDQDDRGIVVVIEPHPSAADLPAVCEAATLCPAAAITVVE